MKYLLDTCAVSDFFKGNPNTITHAKQCKPSDIAISSISVMEIEFGLANNPQYESRHGAIIRQFISEVNVIIFDHDMAIIAGKIRSQLKDNGTPIGAYDLLIGATAISKGCILITNNMREFQRIANIRLENWS